MPSNDRIDIPVNLVGADLTDKQLRKLQQDMAAMVKILGSVDGLFRDVGGSVKITGRESETLSDVFSKVKKTMKALTAVTAQFAKGTIQTQIAMSKLTRANKEFNASLRTIGLKEFRKQFKTAAAGSQELARGIRLSKQRLDDLLNSEKRNTITVQRRIEAERRLLNQLKKRNAVAKENERAAKQSAKAGETTQRAAVRQEKKLTDLHARRVINTERLVEAKKLGNRGDIASLKLEKAKLIFARQNLLVQEQSTRVLTRQARITERLKSRAQQANSPLQKRLDNPLELLKVQGLLLANYQAINAALSGVGFAARFVVDLDREMFNLQAITATTDVTMQGLRKTIVSVSEATKFTAVEVAKTAVILGQAGFSAKEISDSLKGVTLFASATGSDPAASANLLTTTISAFNLQASDTNRVVNVFTAAINNSKLSLDKLTLGLQFSANIAAKVGVDFTELTAAMGAMANAGVKSGSTLGTGLRRLLTALQSPTTKLKNKMDDLGISFGDIDLATQGVAGVMENLRDAGFSTADAFDVFSVRAGAAFAALSNNASDIERLKESFLLTNAAAKANETQMKSLSNLAKKFSSVFGSLANEAFKPVLLSLKGVVSMFTTLFQALRNPVGVTAIRVLTALMIGFTAKTLFATAALTKFRIGLTAAAVRMKTFGIAALFTKGALTALLTTFRALLVQSVIGGVLVALSLLFDSFTKITSASQKINGALEKSKDTLNSYGESLSALNNKLDSLENKQSAFEAGNLSLKRVQEQLLSTALDLQDAFGDKFGKVFDLAAKSLDPLIDKLKEVRSSIIDLSLSEAALQKKLLGDKQNSLQQGLKNSLVRQPFLNRSDILGGPIVPIHEQFQNRGLLGKGIITDPRLIDRILGGTIGQGTDNGRTDLTTLTDLATQFKSKDSAAVTKLLDDIKAIVANNIARKRVSDSIDSLSKNKAFAGVADTLNKTKQNLNNAFKVKGSTQSSRQAAISSAKATLNNLVPEGSNDAVLGSAVVDARNLLLGAIKDSIIKNANLVLKDLKNADPSKLRAIARNLSQLRAKINSGTLNAAGIESAKARGLGLIQQRAAITRNEINNNRLAFNTDKSGNKTLNSVGKEQVSANVDRARAEAEQFSTFIGGALQKLIDIMAQSANKVKRLFPQLDKINVSEKASENAFTTGVAAAKAPVGVAQERLKAAQAPNLKGKITATKLRELAQNIRDAQESLRKTTLQLATKLKEDVSQNIKLIQDMLAQTRANADFLQSVVNDPTTSAVEKTTAQGQLDVQLAKVKKLRTQLQGLKNDAAQAQAAISGNQAAPVIKQQGFLAGLKSSIATASLNMNNFAALGERVGDTIVNSFSGAVEAVVTGAKSIGAAFKDMVTAILKEIVRLLAQKFAVFLLGQLFSAFGPSATANAAPGGAFHAGPGLGSSIGSGSPINFPSGPIVGAVPVKRHAMQGFMPTRDSVPLLAQPGEVILRKSAVDAIGLDNLKRLNTMGNRVVSRGGSPNLGKPREPDMVKVYVVAPDQKPTGLTSKDVLVTIGEDILTGGQTKALIREVAIGAL